MFKLICFKDNKILHDFILKKSKILIGSADNCDLTIAQTTVSPYHCLLMITDDHIKVIDLESTNGTFVNSLRLQSASLNINDTLTIGSLKFFVEEIIEKNHTFIQSEAQVESILPDSSKEFETQLRPIDSFTIIDGEYCDISFSDPGKFRNTKPLLDTQTISSNYIETDNSTSSLDIFKKSKRKLIEITHMVHGNLIEIKTIPLLEGDYFASSSRVGKRIINIYSLKKDSPLFQVKNGEVLFCDNDLINISSQDNQQYKINHSNETIFIKIRSDAKSTKLTPFMGRDTYFLKRSSIQFSLILSFAFLMLFFKPDIITKTDISPVVYKHFTVSKTKTIASTGSKSSTPFSKLKNKFKKIVQKIRSKPVVKKPVFKLKISTNIKNISNAKTNFFKDTPKESSRTIASLDISASSAENNRLSKSTLSKIGKGNGLWGNKKIGLKGYGSKKGYESAYGAQRTVMKGSIDRDLLMKILREHLPQFRRCYQKELEINDKLKGVIGLNFRILQDGKVSQVNINSKLTKISPIGSNCMSSVLHMIQFPKPKGGGVVDVRQPLSFVAESGQI